MDLYDDIDTKPKTSQIDGWSSGIKMLQTQLAIKKAQLPKAKDTTKKPVNRFRFNYSPTQLLILAKPYLVNDTCRQLEIKEIAKFRGNYTYKK